MQIEAGRYYRTRDGRKAFVAGVSPFASTDMSYRILGFVDGEASYRSWEKDGVWYGFKTPNSCDLVAEWRDQKKGEFWLNIEQNGRISGWVNRADAESNQSIDCIACIKVEWTEGQGMEGEAS